MRLTAVDLHLRQHSEMKKAENLENGPKTKFVPIFGPFFLFMVFFFFWGGGGQNLCFTKMLPISGRRPEMGSVPGKQDHKSYPQNSHSAAHVDHALHVAA